MTKINNWEYTISYSDSNIPVIKIAHDKTLPLPTSLSKYYALTKNSVISFINEKFYVSKPENFNDLFDSFLELIDFSNHKFEDFNVLFAANEKPAALLDFETNQTAFLEMVRNSLYAIWHSYYGVLCLTDNKYNDLMWANYTNNTGFLLEFDYKQFNSNNFIGPHPINYLSTIEKIDFEKLDKNLGFFIVGLLKKNIWQYENEYRFFVRPDIKNNFKVSGRFSNQGFNFDLQERLVSYPKTAILKVILAFNFFQEDGMEVDSEPHSYFVTIQGDNAILKMSLLNKIAQEVLPVELCIISKTDFNLISVPIDLTHVKGNLYKIIEKRELI